MGAAQKISQWDYINLFLISRISPSSDGNIGEFFVSIFSKRISIISIFIDFFPFNECRGGSSPSGPDKPYAGTNQLSTSIISSFYTIFYEFF